MKVTTSQLKSLIKESIHEVMKEQVKGIDIKGHKNLTIESEHSFSQLPAWFKKAKTENAVVYIDPNQLFVWRSGTWKDGVSKKMIWYDGTWKMGVWENGYWWNGTWENGNWEYGVFKDGIWEDGIWEDGIWKNGTWLGGKWLDKKNPHPNER